MTTINVTATRKNGCSVSTQVVSWESAYAFLNKEQERDTFMVAYVAQVEYVPVEKGNFAYREVIACHETFVNKNGKLNSPGPIRGGFVNRVAR